MHKLPQGVRLHEMLDDWDSLTPPIFVLETAPPLKYKRHILGMPTTTQQTFQAYVLENAVALLKEAEAA